MKPNIFLKPTRAIAAKVIRTVDAGLVNGLGKQEPGAMCVEAAVCFAFGLPHGDNPPCVGSAVRDFKIKLNDCQWSSNEARAKGMRKLAVAQLGSDTISQKEFGETVFIRSAQRLMPFVLRKVAADTKVKTEDAAKFLEHAMKCERVKTLEEAVAETKSASAYASASASASASAYAYASASASASAYAYASASASASASAYASASASASASAYAYAYASASAYAYAWFKANLGDEFLIMTGEIALDVLKELKSPGCKWLDLCDLKRAA